MMVYPLRPSQDELLVRHLVTMRNITNTPRFIRQPVGCRQAGTHGTIPELVQVMTEATVYPVHWVGGGSISGHAQRLGDVYSDRDVDYRQMQLVSE